MRGSLQGDFSHLVHEPRKQYSAVRLQQGRVLLDSDWNTQVDLVAHRIRTETRDLVGPSGGPAEDAGFEIFAEPRLSFNGEDRYLTVGGQGLRIPPGADGFTFEAWIWPRPAGRESMLVSRFLKGTGSQFQPDFTVQILQDGRLRLRGGGEALESERKLVSSRLQHVALVSTREWTALYLDGVLAGRHLQGLSLDDRETVFVLGARVAGKQASHGFHGFVREVGLWSVARGLEEVGRDSRRPSTGREEGLLGWWRFDQPGVEVEDVGGRGLRWILGGGRPEHRPQWITSPLQIGAGRYYVDGLLCENHATVAFEEQPDYPGARLPKPRDGTYHIFYLDVWEQLVTSLEDPEIREVALGGADTTVRSRTLAQVKVLPVSGEDELPPDERVLDEWRAFLRRARCQGRLRARRHPSAEVLGNFLYRVEIHTSGGLYGWPRTRAADELAVEVVSFQAAGSGSRLELRDWPEEADPWRTGDQVEAWNDLTDGAGRPGAMASITALDPDHRTLDLDNPLNDLAGHPGRLRRVATFKWSRENASVVFAIAEWERTGQVVVLEDRGQGNLALEPGDRVELFDDEMILQPRPGPIYRVEDVDDVHLRVTLNAPLALASNAKNPSLRRWDQKPRQGEIFTAETIVAKHSWLLLEAGIEVLFEGDGTYRTRDYWCMPARTLTDDIEWPQCSDGSGPEALPPLGIAHHYACLAVLGQSDAGIRLRDCRKTFQPLTEGAVSKAGDTMYGPLVIRSNLTVEGSGSDDSGRVSAGVYYGHLGSPDSVSTLNLKDGSVTSGKLAPDVGTVPPGYSILGPTPEPPPGYVFSGSSLATYHPRAAWVDCSPLPRRDPGPLRGAVAGGRLYVFLESGEVWEYDPADDRWSSRCHRPIAGQAFAVTAAKGRIYVIGGTDTAGRKTGTTLIYDPVSNGWTSGQDMPTRRSHLALAAAGGRIYALGGLCDSWFGNRATSRNEALDVSSDTWSRRRPLPAARYDAAAAGAAGQVHFFGGVRKHFFGLFGGTLTGSHDEYQPSTDRWRRRAPLPTPRSHPGVAAITERIYALGGGGLMGPLAEVEEYDLEIASWRRRPPLPEVADWPAAGAVAGRLLAAGGESTPGCPGMPIWQLQTATTFFIHRKEESGQAEPSEPVEPGSDYEPE